MHQESAQNFYEIEVRTKEQENKRLLGELQELKLQMNGNYEKDIITLSLKNENAHLKKEIEDLN